MHIFHKWGKWSEIKEEAWTRTAYSFGIPVGEPQEYVRHCQERYCLICGKCEKRYLD